MGTENQKKYSIQLNMVVVKLKNYGKIRIERHSRAFAVWAEM